MDIVTTGAIPAAGRWNRDMNMLHDQNELDYLVRLVDELVVARNQRIRGEHHLQVLRELESQAAEKVERQREKMTVHDATMPECRV